MAGWRPSSPSRSAAYARVFGQAYSSAEHGGAVLAAGLFAIALFLFLASLSVYEITRPDRAAAILGAGIASLTDIDQTLAENLPRLREEAAASDEPVLALPGYALPVSLTRAEALSASPETLRAILLARSVDLVDANGLDVFDRTGEQSSDLVSLSSVVGEFVGLLTGSAHARARWVAVAALVAATGLGAATLALNRGFARFRACGTAVLLAALPGYLASRGSGYLLDRFGSDDAFVVDLQTAVQAMLAVPERNFFIAGALGLSLLVAGWFLGLLADSLSPEAAPDPASWDEGGPAPPFDAVPGPAFPDAAPLRRWLHWRFPARRVPVAAPEAADSPREDA